MPISNSDLFNLLVITVMLCCGALVGFDARKLGRSPAESILWAVFAGWFIIMGPVLYLFFRSKFYK